jgi:phage repressor protein C with HTH and peptisase S24 domain
VKCDVSEEKILIIEHIKQIREQLGLNRSEFAQKLELSRSAISEFENGTRSPSKDFILSLHKIGVSIDWFVSGTGKMFDDNKLTSQPVEKKSLWSNELTSQPGNSTNPLQKPPDGGTLKPSQDDGPTAVLERTREIPLIYPGDEQLKRGVVIPFLEDQTVSAGKGTELDEGDNPTRYLRVPEYLAKYPDLAMLPVKGDSMDPTLHDGDMVVCDGGGWDGDGIYVIKSAEKAFVKRVLYTLGGYQVISDNKMYPSYGASDENLRIVGKVRAAMIMMPGRRGGI